MPDVFVENTISKKNNQEKNFSSETPVITPDQCVVPKPSLWQKIKQPLAAYMEHPVGMHFENQEEEEEIILFLRRHPITNLPWILTAVAMFLAPLVLVPIYSLLNPFPGLPGAYKFVLSIFWHIATFSIILVNYLNWFYNVYIVTNERIVDVDFNNLVHRQLSSTRLAKVQDVTYRVNGVIRSIFDYGDVQIQTAGTEDNFEFEAVPQPHEVVKKIGELLDKKEASMVNKTPVV